MKFIFSIFILLIAFTSIGQTPSSNSSANQVGGDENNYQQSLVIKGLAFSNDGYALLKKEESYVSHKPDMLHIDTWGYGFVPHNKKIAGIIPLSKYEKVDSMSEPQADSVLHVIVPNVYEKQVYKLFNDSLLLTQCEYDAINMLNYNAHLKRGSQLVVAISRQISKDSIQTLWMLYIKGKVNGVLTKLPGLVHRRDDECNLYFSCKYIKQDRICNKNKRCLTCKKCKV